MKKLVLLFCFSLSAFFVHADADITVCVDLSCLPSATAPSVFGGFNGWCANCNPVTDPDGDGIYCATVTMPDGDNEYKFFRQEGEEMFNPGDPCTVTNFGFTNRYINVVNGVNQTVTFGWNSCDAMCAAPPASADITLCVDLTCLPSATAPSVFGSFNGWCANCNFVTDPDGDGIYCATVLMPGGDNEYKFFRQEGEEMFSPGDPCTVTNFGFTNRYIDVTGTPQTLTFGWNSCDANCMAPPIGQDPTVAAPDPTCNPGNVISMFSNSYTDVPVDTWLTPWSAASLTDLQIAGNDTKLYENVNFLGIETTGANLIDASGMMAFNIDVWIDNASTFRVKLVDFGADQSFGGGDDTEEEIVFDNPPQEEWVTYYIPLANFINLQNRDNIAQLILSANPPGSARFFVDNVYYSTCPPPGTAAIPTMGEWAMFLFALIMITMGVVFVRGMQTEVGMATGQGAIPVKIRRFPFNKTNYFKAMKHAFGLALVGFAFIYFVWGEIVPADLVGMSLTIPVIAYLIHLFKK